MTGLFGRESLKRGTEKVGIRTEVAGGVVFFFFVFFSFFTLYSMYSNLVHTDPKSKYEHENDYNMGPLTYPQGPELLLRQLTFQLVMCAVYIHCGSHCTDRFGQN